GGETEAPRACRGRSSREVGERGVERGGGGPVRVAQLAPERAAPDRCAGGTEPGDAAVERGDDRARDGLEGRIELRCARKIAVLREIGDGEPGLAVQILADPLGRAGKGSAAMRRFE